MIVVVSSVLGCCFGGCDVKGEVAIDAEANVQSQISPPSYKKAAEEV